MVTWATVRGHLLRGRKVAAEGADWIGLTVEGVNLKLKLAQAMGEPHVVVIADVCIEARLPARAAVVYNGRLATAGLVLEKDRYLLRQWLRLATLDPDLLDRTIDYVSGQAVGVRGSIVGTFALPAPLDNFAD